MSATDENTTNCISCYSLSSGTWTPSIPVENGHCDFTVIESVAYVAYEDGRIEAISLSESGKPSKLLPSLPGKLPCKPFTICNVQYAWEWVAYVRKRVSSNYLVFSRSVPSL